MTRVAVALAVVIALAAGVWMLWPDGERTPSTTTTLPIAASSSTTSTPAGTTTTADDHIVDTVEEAEAILRELWFGWFEGIYNQDVSRINAVVVLPEQVEDAHRQFGQMTFGHPPTEDSFEFEEVEILESTLDCVAIWARSSATFRPGSSAGVHVMRYHQSKWKMISYWVHRGDLWHEDCSVPLQ